MKRLSHMVGGSAPKRVAAAETGTGRLVVIYRTRNHIEKPRNCRLGRARFLLQILSKVS
jgi:hypothetical protein